jgi:hypothetical protein
MYRTYRHRFFRQKEKSTLWASTIRSFREAQSNLERLHLAVTLQFPTLVYFYLQSLLEQGYDIHQFLNIYLHTCFYEQPDLVKLFLEKGLNFRAIPEALSFIDDLARQDEKMTYSLSWQYIHSALGELDTEPLFMTTPSYGESPDEFFARDHFLADVYRWFENLVCSFWFYYQRPQITLDFKGENASQTLQDFDDLPEQYLCLITQEIMTTPVYDAKFPQYIFEKKAILKSLSYKSEHPFTRTPLTPAELVIDERLKEEITNYVAAFQERVRVFD